MEYWSLWELVLVGVVVKRTMYQRKVDVDMLNAVKSVLADVSSVSPLSEQRALCSDEGLTLSQHTLRRSAYPHLPYVDTLYILLLV